jgi:Outer membrane protein beta-barrel domain
MMNEEGSCFSLFFIHSSFVVHHSLALLNHLRYRRKGSMRANGVLKGLLLTMLVAVSSAAVRAQDFKAFLTVGSSSIYNKYSFVEYNNAYHSQYSLGPQFTIGGEVPLTPALGLEFALGVARNDLEVTNSNTATHMSYGINKGRLSGDLVVHVPGTFLHGKPYLLIGPEYDRLAPYGAAASPTSTPGFLNDPYAYLRVDGTMGFNFGGGLELKVHPKLGLRLDLRDHVFAAPRYGLPSTATTGAYFPVEGSVNNVEISVGLVYHFEL